MISDGLFFLSYNIQFMELLVIRPLRLHPEVIKVVRSIRQWDVPDLWQSSQERPLCSGISFIFSHNVRSQSCHQSEEKELKS